MDVMKRIKHYFRHARFRAIELTLMGISLFWGVVLVAPTDTFQASTAYNSMDQLAPESVWAGMMVVVAMFHFFGMLKNDNLVRKTGLILAAGQWYFISTMMALDASETTGWGVYFIIGVLATWLYGKVGGQK